MARAEDSSLLGIFYVESEAGAVPQHLSYLTAHMVDNHEGLSHSCALEGAKGMLNKRRPGHREEMLRSC
jgi:hypothetical protein